MLQYSFMLTNFLTWNKHTTWRSQINPELQPSEKNIQTTWDWTTETNNISLHNGDQSLHITEQSSSRQLPFNDTTSRTGERT